MSLTNNLIYVEFSTKFMVHLLCLLDWSTEDRTLISQTLFFVPPIFEYLLSRPESIFYEESPKSNECVSFGGSTGAASTTGSGLFTVGVVGEQRLSHSCLITGHRSLATHRRTKPG